FTGPPFAGTTGNHLSNGRILLAISRGRGERQLDDLADLDTAAQLQTRAAVRQPDRVLERVRRDDRVAADSGLRAAVADLVRVAQGRAATAAPLAHRLEPALPSREPARARSLVELGERLA